jgi:hypothetical protein
MAKGWQAVTYPGIPGLRRLQQQAMAWPKSTALPAVQTEVCDGPGCLDSFRGGIS